MGLLSMSPEIVQSAEKAWPGHGLELVQSMDAVAGAGFVAGFGAGIFLCLMILLQWPNFIAWLSARASRGAANGTP